MNLKFTSCLAFPLSNTFFHSPNTTKERPTDCLWRNTRKTGAEPSSKCSVLSRTLAEAALTLRVPHLHFPLTISPGLQEYWPLLSCCIGTFSSRKVATNTTTLWTLSFLNRMSGIFTSTFSSHYRPSLFSDHILDPLPRKGCGSHLLLELHLPISISQPEYLPKGYPCKTNLSTRTDWSLSL